MPKQGAFVTAILFLFGAAGALLVYHESSSEPPPTRHVDAQPSATALNGDTSANVVDKHVATSVGGSDPFETATDLYALLQEASAGAKAGNIDAAWLEIKIRNYCEEYSRDPTAYAATTHFIADGAPPDRARLVETARDRLSTRCVGFTSKDHLKKEETERLVAKSAASGNLAAAAEELALSPNKAKPAQVDELVRSIRTSGDPQALLALSDAMAVSNTAKEAAFGDQANISEAQFALQLAACAKGLNCSANGSLMTSYCANGGVCGPYSSFSELVHRTLLTNEGSRRVDEMVRVFLSMEGTHE